MFWADRFLEIFACDASAQEEIAEVHLLVEAGELAVALTQRGLVLGEDRSLEADSFEDWERSCCVGC